MIDFTYRVVEWKPPVPRPVLDERTRSFNHAGLGCDGTMPAGMRRSALRYREFRIGDTTPDCVWCVWLEVFFRLSSDGCDDVSLRHAPFPLSGRASSNCASRWEMCFPLNGELLQPLDSGSSKCLSEIRNEIQKDDENVRSSREQMSRCRSSHAQTPMSALGRCFGTAIRRGASVVSPGHDHG